ncbi:MAG: carbohydrate ABC transporter permease [Ruminococcus sp.]|nr:carbohydrate ABC transporter permease [Ruminococcus sp.]MDD6634242.1 carbohydrate ABC transporter permease [Ruminococcus sp.]MDY3215407.1 carbohydrate ABC transporter permease [Ruminococcus sp.]CDF00512.1 aBC transporter permease protein [Ruminococcus sp. CAG:624]
MNLRKRRQKEKFLSIVLAVFIGFAAFMFIVPTILTISNSFMTSNEITANYGAMLNNMNGTEKTFISDKLNLKFIPDKVTFSQYVSVLFKSPEYLLKFWNSVILVVPITVFQLLVALFASYGFARSSGKLKNIIFFSYIILMLMPYQVTLVPNFLVADKFGLLNTRWSIILPGIFSPFSVFLLTKIMRRIPSSYIEAAKLDGASEWQILFHICIPLCKSALFSVALLVFIDYWNMVEQPLIMLKDKEMHPLSVFLSEINTGDIGLAFAVAVIYMVPSLLMFLYGEEYLVEGITYSGGIKG